MTVFADSKQKSIKSEVGFEAFVKSQQNYLLWRMPEIVKAAYEVGATITPPLRPKTTTRGDFNSSGTNLKRVLPNDPNANAGLAAVLARTQNSKYFRRMPPNILSGLMPTIRIYKTFYPGGFGKGKEQNYEVIFDDTSDPTSILNNHRGTLDLANLLSFDYQFIGSNPAETETCITAKMKLRFQSISALLDERTLYNTDTNGDPKTLPFRFADLVNQAKKIDSNYYKLKVKVGYAPVQESYIQRLLSGADNIYRDKSTKDAETPEKLAKKFADAINDANMFVYVYPVSHDLSFNDNGTIELSIEFRGAVEASISDKDTNVLLQSDAGQKVLAALKAAKLKKEKDLSSLESDYTTTSRDDVYEDRRKSIEKTYEEEEKKIYQDSAVIYQDFIETIYRSGKIRKVKYSVDELSMDTSTMSSANDSVETNTAITSYTLSERTARYSETSLGYATINDPVVLNGMISELKAQAKQNAGNARSSGESATAAGSEPQPSVRLDGNLYTPSQINFIFLQDLLAIAAKTVGPGSTFADENINIVLGNIAIPTSKAYLESVVTTDSAVSEEYYFISNNVAKLLRPAPPPFAPPSEVPLLIQYNLGYLPVSIDYFNKWFFETVVKPGKIEYKLKHFLFDLIELIRICTTKMFGNSTYTTPGSRTLISAASVNKTKWDSLIGSNDYINFSKMFVESGAGGGLVNIQNPSDIVNVIYLYVPTLNTQNINPLMVLENENMGVMTFTVGSNTGILKNISYRKQEIQGVREARMTQEGELATGTFRMKYDASLQLYGPCFFRPGDVIVINPVFFTKDSAENASVRLINDLGLGGVFMVLKTNTDASRDGLSTNLETVFLSYGTAKSMRLTG